MPTCPRGWGATPSWGGHRLDDLGLDSRPAGATAVGAARQAQMAEEIGWVLASLGICPQVAAVLSGAELCEMIRAALELPAFDPDSLRAVGGRVSLLVRSLDVLMGAHTCQDELPDRLLTPRHLPLDEHPLPDLERMKGEHAAASGRDEAGIPGQAVLLAAGLADLAKLLAPLR